MYFFASKLLAFLVSPINWILFLALIAVFARGNRLRRVSRILALVAFLFFTNGFIAGTFLNLLEVEAVAKHEIQQTYDAGILLGGMVNFRSDSNLVNFNQNGDRMFQTMSLYKSGRINKIVISSGSGLIQLPSFREAYLAKKYLLSLGFPPEDILIEATSRNTHENALETGKLLKAEFGPLEDRKFLLITSASHMRRAMGCFRKEGIDVIPYSTTMRGYRGPFVFRSEMILPDPYALEQWKILMSELTGLAVYKLQGYL